MGGNDSIGVDLTDEGIARAFKEYDVTFTRDQSARARMEALRVGMQELLAQAQASKRGGRLRDQRSSEYEVLYRAGVRLLLGYVGNGYITRVWHELEGQKP